MLLPTTPPHTLSVFCPMSVAAARIDVRSARSHCTKIALPPLSACPFTPSTAFSPLSLLLASAKTVAPFLTSWLVVSNPMPVFAPVTTATLPVWSGISRAGCQEGFVPTKSPLLRRKEDAAPMMMMKRKRRVHVFILAKRTGRKIPA